MTQYQIESEIRKLKRRLCCIKSTLFFDDFASFPVTGSVDTLYVDNSTGSIYIWDGATYITQSGGGGSFTLYKENSSTVTLTGEGTLLSPLVAESLIPPINHGIISGGIVTWISGYTYSVSPAVYYINGVQYNSPYTEITLTAADVTNNRLDAFVLTNLGTAIAITGTPSTNPELPYVNTGTQIQASFALVTANTTQPVGLQQEYIYRENVGTPTEWAATSSNAGRINVAGILTPNNGTVDINATGVLANDTLTLTRISTFQPLLDKTVLIFYIKSKATWNNNRVLNFQFKNGGANVGLSVRFSNNTFGFVSSQTSTWQRIVIPLDQFGLTPSDVLDTLLVTVTGTGGTLGFLIDDMELQGATVINNYVGTTDNVGVFYVSKNYTGIGAAIFSNSLYTVNSITSSNAGYMQQLQLARMGDANKAYPDPWAARNAAMDAMVAGTITKALIVINGGNTWTYGSYLSANNGDINGVSTNPTVADIGFISAGDSSSLLKDNINYYFNPTSKLINIAKIQIFVGRNIDATDTKFVSGIYGYGDFTCIYGTLEGLSTRFIEIDNANAEVTFEGNTFIGQRACFFVQNYKTLNVTLKTWIGGLRDTVIYEKGINREGDGSPSNLFVNIDTILSGTAFFPYPISTAGTTAALFEFAGVQGGLTAIRQKNKIYNINTIQHISNVGSGGLLKGQSSDNLVWQNLNFVMNIKSYNQKIDPSLASGLGGGLIAIFYTNGAALKQNTHWTFNIDTANVELTLFDGRNGFTHDPASINNSVTLNVNYIRKKVTFTAGTFLNDSIFGLPMTQPAYGLTGEKPTYIFNIGEAIADVGYVFANSGSGSGDVTSYNYNAKCIIKGNLKTLSANPPIMLRALGSSCILKDCILISGGASCIDGTVAGKLIYTKDVLSNVTFTANVTQQGVLTVDTNILNYL